MNVLPQGVPVILTHRVCRFLGSTLLMGAALAACVCSRDQQDQQIILNSTALEVSKSFVLDEALAKKHLQVFTTSPHPFGSDRQVFLSQYIQEQIASDDLQVSIQKFSAEVPNPAVRELSGPVSPTLTFEGQNIIAVPATAPSAPCLVLIASHYDTKVIPGLEYVGANDSGSSSVALMRMMQFLSQWRKNDKQSEKACQIAGVWFDGEEPYLADWNDGLSHPAKIQDNTYGSRLLASKLNPCEDSKQLCFEGVHDALDHKPLVALILMDMIGSPDLMLSRDYQSSANLVELALAAARHESIAVNFSQRTQAIEDDHVPFAKKGVQVINLIDFNNLDFWHRPGDEMSQVSLKSMEKVGRLATYLGIHLSLDPPR